MLRSFRIKEKRGRQVLPRAASSFEEINTHSPSPRVKELLANFMQLPRPDSVVSFWVKIPFVYPPFLFKRRLVQQILFGGNELRNGIIEEYSLHVLVEALFITVTCQPIFSNVFIDGVFDIPHACLVTLFYCTIVIQVLSLSVNIVWMCAVVQLQDSIFQEWMAARLVPLHISGIMHSVSFYLFLLCILAWPLVVYPYPQSLMISGLPLTIALLACWRGGPLMGLITRVSSPLLMVAMTPHDEKLRGLASEELELLMRSYTAVQGDSDSDSFRAPSPPSPTRGATRGRGSSCNSDIDGKKSSSLLRAYLDHLGMQHLLQTFENEHIYSCDTLPDLTEADFKCLGIPIGDRIRIQKGVAAFMDSFSGTEGASDVPVSAGGASFVAERSTLYVSPLHQADMVLREMSSSEDGLLAEDTGRAVETIGTSPVPSRAVSYSLVE